jgi:hypothetical protein
MLKVLIIRLDRQLKSPSKLTFTWTDASNSMAIFNFWSFGGNLSMKIRVYAWNKSTPFSLVEKPTQIFH